MFMVGKFGAMISNSVTGFSLGHDSGALAVRTYGIGIIDAARAGAYDRNMAADQSCTAASLTCLFGSRNRLFFVRTLIHRKSSIMQAR